MKKKYIQPVMQVIDTTTSSIMAGSATISGGGSNGNGGPTKAEGKDGFFDDDEDWE